MSYTKLTDFAAKDSLLSGNPGKLVRGSEIGAEFDAIESAMAAAEAVNITAPVIVASTSKTTPVDADLVPIIDSAASNVLKKLTWANLKATLKTYFDTLYAATGAFAASGANSDITSLSALTNGIVGTSGDQTIGGTKTFSTQPVLPQKITRFSPAVTTSGSSIGFTSIPSWVTKIVLSLDGVSTNGTTSPYIQIGDSGGLETTGYTSTGYTITGTPGSGTSTVGFLIAGGTNWSSAYTATGHITLTLHDPATNTWVCSTVLGNSGTTAVLVQGGKKALSAVLDRISLVTSDTFDAGSISGYYE